MKRIVSLFLLVCLVGCVFTGCARTEIVITDTEVQTCMLYNKIYNSIHEKLLIDAMGSKEETQEMIDEISKPITYDEVYDQVFRVKVIDAECDRLGLEKPTDESVSNYAAYVYDTIDENTQEKYDQAIKLALEKHGVTEDRYDELIYTNFYNDLRASSLREYYENNICDDDNIDDISFQKYVDKLLKKYYHYGK